MATRSLTEVFILMRNNAMQNRHIFLEQTGSDYMALVNHDDTDIELANNTTDMHANIPPIWSESVDEIQCEIAKIKKKMKDLSVLHDRHLNRPTLDDSIDEEKMIDLQTEDITQMFRRCQRLVEQLSRAGRMSLSAREKQLNSNMSASVARSLQETSTQFRTSQSAYLNKLRGREERSKRYFQSDVLMGMDEVSVDIIDQRFTSSQLQMLEDNTLFVQQREKEIVQIVRSIQDLNDIFKDLAAMVVDQGTILDRIDYNVEASAVSVERGLEQLQKAEKYQKKSKKMVIILVMFVILILLAIILLAVKVS